MSNLPENLKILIADDDEDDVLLVRELILEGLKDINIQFTALKSGENIVENMSRVSFDLCILDFRLGTSDGLQILKAIKSARLSVPVIFLTGQGDQKIAVKAMKEGAFDYIVKGEMNKTAFADTVRNSILKHKRNIEIIESERILERQRSLLVAISEGSKAILTKNQPEAGIRKALSILGRSIKSESAWVCKVVYGTDPEEGRLETQYSWERSEKQSEAPADSHIDWNQWNWMSIQEKLTKGNILEFPSDSFPQQLKDPLLKQNIESLCLIPIGFKDDFWGILIMGFPGMKVAFTQDINSLLMTFASTLGGQIRRLAEEESFHSIVEGTSANMGKGFFSSLVKSLGQALSVEHVLICEMQNFSGKYCQLVSGWDGVKEYSGSQIKITDSPAEEMLAGLNSFIPDNLSKQFSFDWFSQNGKVRSFAGVPFFDTNSKIQGFLCVADKAPLKNSSRVLSVLRIFASRTGAELQRQKVEQRMRDMAYHDSLTGLPNRVLLEDRLKVALTHAERNKHHVALLFLDFDNFKTVNDIHGHQNGDLLLKEQSKRLIDVLRKGDTVARFGGDEFVLLLPDIQHPADAAKLALKVNESVKPPLVMDGKEVKTSVSIGISLFPIDGRDSKSLLRRADDALFAAKRKGRDSFEFATPYTSSS